MDNVISIHNIDWDLLHQQKQMLVKVVWNTPNNELWGVVHLIDTLQDIACEVGLWKFPEKEDDPIFPKWKLKGPESVSTGALLWDMNSHSPYLFDGKEWKSISIEEYRRLLEKKAGVE